MRIFVFLTSPSKLLKTGGITGALEKFLIKNGFVMLQESVYCRMALNQTIVNSVTQLIKKNRPPKGLVQVMNVTEKQFSRMEFITGKFTSDVIDSDERLVIL